MSYKLIYKARQIKNNDNDPTYIVEFERVPHPECDELYPNAPKFVEVEFEDRETAFMMNGKGSIIRINF